MGTWTPGRAAAACRVSQLLAQRSWELHLLPALIPRADIQAIKKTLRLFRPFQQASAGELNCTAAL